MASSQPQAPPDPLESARLKARRAERQFQVLAIKVQRFLASNAYAPWVETNDDGSELTFGIDVNRNPPLEWSVLIGEIVHNLRSALDHAAWQLVIHDGGTGHDRTQFPIFLKPTPFGLEKTARGKRPGMMEGMKPESIALIKSLQPFDTGEGENSPLWRLYQLSNFDKHKALHVAAGVIQDMKAKHGPLKATSGEGGTVEVIEFDPGPYEANAVLARLRAYPAAFPAPDNVEMERPAVVNVVFGKSSPVKDMLVVDGLNAIGQRVWYVIHQIAAERFPPSD